MTSKQHHISAYMDALARLQTALSILPYQHVHESFLLICLIRIQLQEISGMTGSAKTGISEVEPLTDFLTQIEWFEGVKDAPATDRRLTENLDRLFVSLISLTSSVHRQIAWHRPSTAAPAQATA
jgi:hypothetical protein